MLRRRSQNKHNDVIYLHLFHSHFSYITDIDKLVKKFKCDRCYVLFNRCSNLQRHMQTCLAKTTVIHPSRLFHAPKNVFEELDQLGIHVDKNKRFYNYRLCWDIEAYMNQSKLPSTEKLQFLSEHKLASISISSNVPGTQSTVCFVSKGDEKALVSKAMDHMIKISERTADLMLEKHREELKLIDELGKTM